MNFWTFFIISISWFASNVKREFWTFALFLTSWYIYQWAFFRVKDNPSYQSVNLLGFLVLDVQTRFTVCGSLANFLTVLGESLGPSGVAEASRELEESMGTTRHCRWVSCHNSHYSYTSRELEESMGATRHYRWVSNSLYSYTSRKLEESMGTTRHCR